MTWAEFLAAIEALRIELDSPPALTMAGVAGDNATRYLDKQKGLEFPNNEALFLVADMVDSDFIWNRRLVRAHCAVTTGGHPALAGYDPIYCAGVVMDRGFFFHSGHYKPVLENALHFFADLVINSCSGLSGAVRDQKVALLCGYALKLYVSKSKTKTYTTCFAEQAERVRPQQVSSVSSSSNSSTATAPMKIGGLSMAGPMAPPRSMPMSIGGPPPRSTPISISSSSQPKPPPLVIDDTPGSVMKLTGIDSYGQHQLQFRVNGAPPWIDDSARSKCALCKAVFGTFTRKHHCRRCGEIVCANCSKHTKNVRSPAVNPKKEKDAEKQPVRVCDTCFNTLDLI
jgi:hypothetical protein